MNNLGYADNTVVIVIGENSFTETNEKGYQREQKKIIVNSNRTDRVKMSKCSIHAKKNTLPL